MAVPKMSRHEMKQDDLSSAVERFSGYVAKNPAVARNAGLGAAAVVALGLVIYWFLSSGAAASAESLHEAQARLSAPIVPSGAQPQGKPPTYSSESERDRAALDAFNQLVASHGRRAEGKIGRYYQGILLNRLGKPAEAEVPLREFLDSAPTPALAGLARVQLAQARAGQGDLEGAAKMFSDLAEDKQSGFPRDFALFSLAGVLEQQGKKADALAAYKKVSTEFPNTPLAAEAARHLK